MLCTICHEEVRVQTLQCGHTFHDGCIEPWLARRRTCPNCRQPGVLRTADNVESSSLPSESCVQTTEKTKRLSLLISPTNNRLASNINELYHSFVFLACSIFMFLIIVSTVFLFILSTILKTIFRNSAFINYKYNRLLSIIRAIYAWEKVPYFYLTNDNRRYILSRFLITNPILTLFEFVYSFIFMLVTPIKIAYSLLNILFFLGLVLTVIHYLSFIKHVLLISWNYLVILEHFILYNISNLSWFCDTIFNMI